MFFMTQSTMASQVLPKTLDYEKISTTEMIERLKAPQTCALRVDFAGKKGAKRVLCFHVHQACMGTPCKLCR